MKKKLNILTKLLTIIGTILFIIMINYKTYSIPYSSAVFFFLVLTALNYVNGIYQNEKRIYKENIKIYIGMYFVLLLALTTSLYRVARIPLPGVEEITHSMNLIPFKTISEYLQRGDTLAQINLLGNICAFIPLAFLLIVADKDDESISKNTLIVSLSVLGVEIIQFLTRTGSLDIDDFILNIGGAFIFTLIMSKTNLSKLAQKLFYTDYKMTSNLKIVLFILLILLSVSYLSLAIYEVFFL